MIGRTHDSIYPMFAVKLELEYFGKPTQVNDMTKEIEKKSWEMMTGAERVILGCQMFDSYRAEIIASLPKDLPEEEFKRQLFERIYGAPMEDFLSGKVNDSTVSR